MKFKPKVSMVVVALVLLTPMLFSSAAVALNETWGISEGDYYEYTFGIDGSVLLPSSVWDRLSEEAALGLNDAFNNSYDVGYADAYVEGYESGWINESGDPWSFTNPYEGSLIEGQENGWWQGYYDGYYEWYDNHTYKQYYYEDWVDDYLGDEIFTGFPQAELDAFDLETIYGAFLAMPKIFNLKINIDHMYEDTFINEWNNPDQELYYDVINITVELKQPGGVYMAFEDFMLSYMNTEVRAFIMAAFTGTIRDNITAQFDEGYNHLVAEVASPDFEPPVTNRGIIWGTGTNITIETEEFAQDIAFEVLNAFGFNMEQRPTYDSGWSNGYEEGYIEGYSDTGVPNPYDGWSDYTSYESGLRDGWYNGRDDGYWDQYYSYSMYGPYYNNYNQDAPEYYQDPAEFPSGYGYFPGFIPSDLDVGAELEKLKDVANIELGRSHLIFLGGFNGIVEQMGLDFITNEKQIYIAGNLEDPQFMFGKVLDLGSMLFIDQLNELILNESLGFVIDNESMEADGVINLQWDSNGVLLNYHVGLHIGMIYDVTNTLGINLVFDLSRGANTVLNAEFPDVLPTQKYYPPSVNGNWGIDEGDVYDFTTSIDMNIELPDYFWAELNDLMWEQMNDSYYWMTDGLSLPVGETVDMENIFHTFITEIPNVINFQSKITDMLGIDETQELWEDVWVVDHYEWTYVGDVEHQYDFIAQYLLAKTPAETVYEPVGRLILDMYDGFYAAVGNSFPETYANYIQGEMDGLLNDILSDVVPGTDVSVFDIVSYFVPTTLQVWGVSSNDTFSPEWAKMLGIADEFFFDLMQEATAMPSFLYIPTDFSFQSVYDEFLPWAEIESSGSFTEDQLIEYMTDLSMDDYYVSDNEIYLRWDIDDGMDDIFFSTTGLDADIPTLISDIYLDTGVLFDDNTISGKLLFNWRYDDFGVLENFHIQFGAGMQTTEDEELSFSIELDISRGEFAGKNGQFLGEPLIHTYDHWMYPSLTHTLIIPTGTGNIINIDSETYDVHMSLEVSAIDGARISTQIWGSDPSQSDMFMSGTGVFFAIDVDEQSNIQLPLTLTIDLRPELLALDESVLEELFTIYSYDDVTNDWVEEDFAITFDSAAGTVEIVVDHLSAFAIGAMKVDDTSTDDDDDDGGVFDGIPGYGAGFLILAVGATVVAIISRKRK
ncbi:MAG: hypothetical protein ACTSYU_06945 [Promethearchaeota archaeon]